MIYEVSFLSLTKRGHCVKMVARALSTRAIFSVYHNSGAFVKWKFYKKLTKLIPKICAFCQ